MVQKNKKNGQSAGNGSIVIGGNVHGSNIVMGNNNVSNQSINITQSFETIYKFIDEHPKLQTGKKEDAKAELAEIKTALEEPNPDEGFITRRFRNIKRMAPDIVEVAFETLTESNRRRGEVIKRIAKKWLKNRIQVQSTGGILRQFFIERKNETQNICVDRSI
ncbi:MAG: hypothetical protein IPN96_15950 [Anaerolineales bacterium]|nr:hypothetical protein [Anaerolineales bacterium]